MSAKETALCTFFILDTCGCVGLLTLDVCHLIEGKGGFENTRLLDKYVNYKNTDR